MGVLVIFFRDQGLITTKGASETPDVCQCSPRPLRGVTLQDLVVKLSEVLVGVCVIGATEGPPELAEMASTSMVALATKGDGRDFGIQAPVLQALMPVVLMSTGKGDVPPRCASRFFRTISIPK